MIRYQLQCPQEHLFEAWFRSSAAFDEQAGSGHIDCPLCGSREIIKALMAPNISPKTRAKGKPDHRRGVSGAENADGPDGSKAVPGVKAGDGAKDLLSQVDATTGDQFATQSEFVNLMRKIRKEVEQKADYVGASFAEEARKIHHEEAEIRGIYGEATPDEVEELFEEGVEFYPLPTLPEDNN